MQKSQIHKEYLKLFSVALFTHSDTFFFAKIKKPKDFFSFLFPCVSLDQHINQIDIVDPKVIFPLILKDIEFFHHINHLKIKGNDSRELQGLIYQLNAVNAISFH